MKNPIDKIARYTALILLSSLPLPSEVFADIDKKQSTRATPGFVKKSPEARLKILANKPQSIDHETE